MARINLIAWDNGVGLSTDLHLLGERLKQDSHRVNLSTIRRLLTHRTLSPH